MRRGVGARVASSARHHRRGWARLIAGSVGTEQCEATFDWTPKLWPKPILRLYISSISASPTACPLRGYGRAGAQNDRLGEAAVLSTGAPTPAQWACRRRGRDRADVERHRSRRPDSGRMYRDGWRDTSARGRRDGWLDVRTDCVLDGWPCSRPRLDMGM